MPKLFTKLLHEVWKLIKFSWYNQNAYPAYGMKWENNRTPSTYTTTGIARLHVYKNVFDSLWLGQSNHLKDIKIEILVLLRFDNKVLNIREKRAFSVSSIMVNLLGSISCSIILLILISLNFQPALTVRFDKTLYLTHLGKCRLIHNRKRQGMWAICASAY